MRVNIDPKYPLKSGQKKNDSEIRTFSGATAIITGGASGIGRALAEELAIRGCEVVVVDLQLDLACEVTSAIRKRGGRASSFRADVADFNALQQLVNETFNRTGRIDYFFNNAGINIVGDAAHYSIDDWRLMVETNLLGVVNGVQAVYGIMIDQGFGHIVNTASMAGVIPFPGLTAYSMTKHAVVGLSLSLHGEAAYRGVRVSVLCPGFVRTPILKNGGYFGKRLCRLSPDQEKSIEIMIRRCRPLSSGLVARKILNGVARNRLMIFLPRWYRLIWRINCLFSSVAIALGNKRYKKVQNLLDEDRKR